MQLLTYPSYVESPFIIVKIGNYTFGQYQRKEKRDAAGTRVDVTYPNFVQSLQVKKVNGTLNSYTIQIVYAITQFDDPNMLEAVFGSISKTRTLTISYGDYASPTFIYKEEKAIIKNVTSDIDISGSKITYKISCISDSLSIKSTKKDFPKRYGKPSNIIRDLLNDATLNLKAIFPGMRDMKKVEAANLIASGDKEVTIEAKQNIDILEYINYLVACMTPDTKTDSSISLGCAYYLYIDDDLQNEFGGAYFKVTRVLASIPSKNSYDTYEVDVGYPEKDKVINFTINNDQEWAILYNYSKEIEQNNYSYRIDNSGNMVSEYSPSLATSSKLLTTTQANKNWWAKMTEFPITASLQIKGLLRPQMLMTYIRINVYFYGQKHVSSGLYIITNQQDSVDSSGYRTTLSLLRIGGDNS